jgi:hypothetical protein
MNIIDCVVFVQIAKKRAVFGHKKRDIVSSFKEVADSVHLDPWRTGICPVCFG